MIFRHLTGFLRKHGRISKRALERSSSTISREIKPRVSTDNPTNFHAFTNYSFKVHTLERNKYHPILTLDPNKFVEKKQQCLHIGNRKSFKPHVMLQNQSVAVECLDLRYDIDDYTRNTESGTKTQISASYPIDNKFFLYYFTPPGKPRIAAELRLRVTSSGAPTSFESGSDLLLLNGHPWSRPLCVLPKYYKPLYEKLREDRLVPDDLDAILSTSSFTSSRPIYQQSQFLYTLNDTFIVDFSCSHPSFHIITEQGVETIRFTTPFFERPGGQRTLPYTGAFTNHHLSILLD
jgi:hypothetical protein